MDEETQQKLFMNVITMLNDLNVLNEFVDFILKHKEKSNVLDRFNWLECI